MYDQLINMLQKSGEGNIQINWNMPLRFNNVVINLGLEVCMDMLSNTVKGTPFQPWSNQVVLLMMY